MQLIKDNIDTIVQTLVDAAIEDEDLTSARALLNHYTQARQQYIDAPQSGQGAGRAPPRANFPARGQRADLDRPCRAVGYHGVALDPHGEHRAVLALPARSRRRRRPGQRGKTSGRRAGSPRGR
jgi:hypothetical protein